MIAVPLVPIAPLLAEQMLTGDWVIALVGAVITSVITAMIAWKKGQMSGSAIETDHLMTRRESDIKVAAFDARLGSLEKRFDAHLGQVRHELTELSDRMTQNHAEVLRAIGRLEGRVTRD